MIVNSARGFVFFFTTLTLSVYEMSYTHNPFLGNILFKTWLLSRQFKNGDKR